jgi:hypothetical protein
VAPKVSSSFASVAFISGPFGTVQDGGVLVQEAATAPVPASSAPAAQVWRLEAATSTTGNGRSRFLHRATCLLLQMKLPSRRVL